MYQGRPRARIKDEKKITYRAPREAAWIEGGTRAVPAPRFFADDALKRRRLALREIGRVHGREARRLAAMGMDWRKETLRKGFLDRVASAMGVQR